jgi:hypothetical protein
LPVAFSLLSLLSFVDPFAMLRILTVVSR